MMRIISAPLKIIRAILLFTVVGLVSFLIGLNASRG